MVLKVFILVFEADVYTTRIVSGREPGYVIAGANQSESSILCMDRRSYVDGGLQGSGR